MAFKTPLYDAIKEQLLTDWRSVLPNADTSIGSMIYADSEVLASAIWGLYKNQNWIRQNMSPDATSSEVLKRWAFIYGVSTEGKTNEQILNDLYSSIRNPNAGGNKADVERWALSVTSNGLLDLPLKRAIPGSITNSGFPNFVEENFTNGDELKGAFSTGGAAIGSSFQLDYSSGQSEELVSLGMWKYFEEDVSFKVEYSDDGANYTEIVSSFVLTGLGWSFVDWGSVGPRRFWRVSLLATTTEDVSIGEVEFYRSGIEKVDSAKCYKNYLAIGTFHVVCSRVETRVSNKILEGIFEFLDFKIPIAPHEFWVLRPKEIPISVEVEVEGPANVGLIEGSILNYIRALIPGQPFLLSAITVICQQNGATNSNIIVPTSDEYPLVFEEFVEDQITVSKV